MNITNLIEVLKQKENSEIEFIIVREDGELVAVNLKNRTKQMKILLELFNDT